MPVWVAGALYLLIFLSPLVVLVVYFQRLIVSGLSAGAVKG